MPDHVVSSPAKRASQTAIKVCKRLDFKKSRIFWEERLYEAGVPELLGVLANCPGQAATVLLIGHNPGLEDLVRHLAGDDLPLPEDGKLMPTATVARFEMPDDWSRLDAGSAHLLSMTRPRSL